MIVWALAALGLFLVAGCGALGPEPTLVACQHDLDCYTLSPDTPFACWRCDKMLAGGTCVQGDDAAPAELLDIDIPAEAKLRIFSTAGQVTLVAERNRALGNEVTTDSFVMQLDDRAMPQPVALVSSDAVVSQLAVAGDDEHAWCLAVDHRSDGDGHLCLGRCTDAACGLRMCEQCGTRQPSLAVKDCRASNGECSKLLAYVTKEPAVVAQAIAAAGDPLGVPLPDSLDPTCGPLALRVQREGEARFLLAAAQQDRATPWLGLLSERDDGRAHPIAEERQSGPQAAALHTLAGAAAEGSDADGGFLLAWIAQIDAQARLMVARGAWGGGDVLTPLEPVLDRALKGSAGEVSVAYARYGPSERANGPGPGGWVVAFRDDTDGWAIRVDRGAAAAPVTGAAQHRATGLRGFAVASHPAGSASTSPFLFVDLSDSDATARIFECTDPPTL